MAVAIAPQPIAAEPVPAADVAEVVAGPAVAGDELAPASRRELLGYPPVWAAAAKLVAYVAAILVLVVTPPALALQLLARLLAG